MTAEKRISFAVSILCLLSVLAWLYYWLFVASRPAESTLAFVGSVPIIDLSDPGLRYRPYIPLVVDGVFGSIVGSIAGGLVFVVNRRLARGNQPAAEILISAGLGVFSATLLAFAIWFVWLAFFDQSLATRDANPLLLGIGMLLRLPGLGIFCGFPALLGSVGTSCLLHGLRTNSRPQSASKASADVNEPQDS